MFYNTQTNTPGPTLLTLERGHARENRTHGNPGYSLIFLYSRCYLAVWAVNATLRPLYSLKRDPVPMVQEAGWVPGSIRTGAENLAPHRKF